MSGAQRLLDFARAVLREYPHDAVRRLLKAPVFLVSAPRAGSNMLFEALAEYEGLWTIGGESHGVYRAFPHLEAENDNLDSGCLYARHADAATLELLPACFLALLRDNRQQPFMALPEAMRPATVTLLEKTPRNALNIGFLLAVFPDARFIYLYRDPRENIASLVEAWTTGLRTGRFVTFRNLPGWDREAWCFLLPPGWRQMVGRSLAEIAAFQWTESNEAILDSLRVLPPGRCKALSYRQLVENPPAALQALGQFAGVPLQTVAAKSLPLSRTSLTPPDRDKWRVHEREIAASRQLFEPTWQRVRSFAEENGLRLSGSRG